MAEIVLVHGSRLNAACWGPLVAELDGHVVHAPDLPGHGTRVGETFTLAAGVETVREVVRGCAEPPVLVGHSLGGYVVLEAAAGATTGEITGLALLGASAEPSTPLAAPYRVMGEGVRRALTSPRLTEALSAADRALLAAVLPSELAASVVERGVDLAAIPDAWSEVVENARLTHIVDVEVPVLAVNGARDQFRVGERQLREVRPDVEVVRVPGTHFAPMTHPVEVAAALEDFLAGLPGRVSRRWRRDGRGQ